MATQDDFIRTALRVPPDLHKAIHEAAASANRTFNAEIVARLQTSFHPPTSEADLMEMKHFFESSDTEREMLRETGRHLQKIIDAQDVNIIMLQAYLVDVINALPKKLQSDERIKIAAKFVLGLGQGTDPPAQQTMLPLAMPITVETVKATVRGKKVDTGVVVQPSPDGDRKAR